VKIYIVQQRYGDLERALLDEKSAREYVDLRNKINPDDEYECHPMDIEDFDDWRKQIVTDYATPWCWYVNPEKLGYTREQAEQIDREEAEPCGSNLKKCGSYY
jgi:hypothetical protein